MVDAMVVAGREGDHDVFATVKLLLALAAGLAALVISDRPFGVAIVAVAAGRSGAGHSG
jgi:hypothetical protein